MAEHKEIVDITPDRSLISKMGQASHYDLWQALSELIDNSIDARINEIKEPVEISIQFKELGGTFIFGDEGEYDIEVSDNGKGMSFEEFATCLKLAYVDKKKQKKTRLGKFGLGLKTSVSSLGSKFKIVSKAYKGNERYSLVFDEKEFTEKGEWAKFQIIKERDESDWHGTIIKIRSRKEVKMYTQKIQRLKEKFGLQYSHLIENNIVRIKVNASIIKPSEVELEKDPDLAPKGKYPINIKLPGGYEVTGWYGFRVLGAKKSGVVSMMNYGFHLYWRQRLVAEFEKIGIRVHTDFQRLIGELHLDNFPVTHDKTSIIRECDEYDFLAGPRRGDDPESRHYTEGELWKAIQPGWKRFQKNQKDRYDMYREIDSAIESHVISLGTGRKLKNKIKKNEITSSRVKKVISDEAKITQEKIKPFLDNEKDQVRRVEDTKEYKEKPQLFEGYSLYFKRCSPEEAEFIVVREEDKKVKKYLDKDRKEVSLPKFFETQD